MKQDLILTINPGSTSTKIGVFRGTERLMEKTIRHSAEELAPFKKITDQYNYRKETIIRALQEAEVDLSSICIVMGRGGLIKPVPSGVFEVNDRMEEDLRAGLMGEHASNLGGLIARDIAKMIPGARAFIADPVVVDEMEDVARVAGHPAFQRYCVWHALNQKAIARLHAEKIEKPYEELSLIVVHLGGGISVGAHYKGRVIDVNQALDGDGPFSPERSGTLPVGPLAKLCFSGKYTYEEVKKMITGKGGYVAYLGTNNAQEVEERVQQGDGHACLIRNALVYQVAREIGAMSTVLKGEVDGILLTGGIAYSEAFTRDLSERIKHLGPVFIYPGEDELRALAYNGLRVLEGKEKVQEYV